MRMITDDVGNVLVTVQAQGHPAPRYGFTVIKAQTVRANRRTVTSYVRFRPRYCSEVFSDLSDKPVFDIVRGFQTYKIEIGKSVPND